MSSITVNQVMQSVGLDTGWLFIVGRADHLGTGDFPGGLGTDWLFIGGRADHLGTGGFPWRTGH